MAKGSKVKTIYRKAAQTPSKRRRAAPAHSEAVRMPTGGSPLSRYIEDNSESGLSVRELIEQFQEYDCDHPKAEQHVVAAGSTYQFVQCRICERVEKKFKPGVKPKEDEA